MAELFRDTGVKTAPTPEAPAQRWQAPGASRRAGYKRRWLAFIVALVFLDGLAVWGSLILAFTLRISSGLLAYFSPYSAATYHAVALASVPAWWVLFAASGLYRRDNLLGGVGEYRQVLKACTSGVIVLIVVSFFFRDAMELSRGWLLGAWALSCVCVGLERFLMRRVAYWLRQRGWFITRVLIVGASEQGVAIARHWAQSPTAGMQVVGFVDDFKPLGTPVLDGLTVLGRPTALAELVRRTDAQEVVVVPNAIAWETFEEIVAHVGTANGYTVRLSPGYYELLATGVAVTHKSFVPLLTIDEARIVGIDLFLKTALDYGLALPLGVLTLPLLGLFALILRLGRPGPVLARYRTIGRGGVLFTMFKFRTLASGVRADAPGGMPADHARPPASWLERVLYRSGLDKLPQLWNVLAGQMSLVGPRPRVLGEGKTTLQAIRNLCTVKPGIVGTWLGRKDSTPEEELQELYYVRHWTIWLDLHILFRTAVEFLGSGRLSAGNS